ncbi:carbohydrate esterase family 3 protein [Apiospora arundinis]|uniref:Carbohydrate esterase family 3 protein n=1 Tax=Apiospora arundinis TaxID=335852 RepID=A0ABR2HYS7_9PEZI
MASSATMKMLGGAFLAASAVLQGVAATLDGPSPWTGEEFGPDVVTPSTLSVSDSTQEVNATSLYVNDERENDLSTRADKFWLRVMPLGASITQGIQSTDGNGYRKHIRDQLRFAGWNVNMVGSKRDGNMNDKDNEGHPGWVISQVTGAAKDNAHLRPNLVMINAGTNDCIQNIDVDNAGKRMKAMLDLLKQQIPETTILLSTIVPSASRQSCVENVNRQYKNLKDEANGVYIAEMKLTMSDITNDGVHPTDEGYRKMAAAWWAAFQRAESKLKAPSSNINDEKETQGGAGGGSKTCAKSKDSAGRGPVQTQLEGTGADDGNYRHRSTPGISFTVPASSSIQYQFAQLVNLGGADRGGETDELVKIERQGDGSNRYSYYLNNGGRYDMSTIGFSLPFRCDGNVAHVWGDINNDGLDDLWCIGAQGQATVALNRGGNPPRFESVGEVIASPGPYGPGDVLVADIDGDGRADYCIQENNGDIRCWRNAGSGDKPSFWQSFARAEGGGDVVFTGKGKPNKNMVRMGDLNGNFRSDWMYIGDQGQVETWINQRGWGTGMVPDWVSAGQTHPGAGPGSQIKFGRVYGSGRLDYIWMKPAGNNIEVTVFQNLGEGGLRRKGDGVYYCDMTGSGSDDYVWVWSAGDKAELYVNNHSPPNWKEDTKTLFNIGRNRRSIHLADWDGDGKCDVLSQRKSDGALEWWRNGYDKATGRFTFEYKGFVDGSNRCNQGWGVNLFDRGLRLADIDGDGRADYLCLEKDGRTTGFLNTKTGIVDVGQIKFSEGWDRANIRFADVEGSGRADLIWVDKYTGQGTVMKNKGRQQTGGSSFTWENRGVLYPGIGERGANMHFANLGGKGRADFVQVLPVTNRAYTWFNECPGTGGGDDGPIVDPKLPAYTNSKRSRVMRGSEW